VTHVTVVMALVAAATATAASYVSAWRGRSLDPVTVLRTD
jgi:ABC-type lipoprotein release transport system permease subunit